MFSYRNFVGSALYFKIRSACCDFLNANFALRTAYKMRTAYFQHSEGEERVHIKIHFNDFNVNKVLNFERSIFEKVDLFTAKLDTKLLRILTKKKKNAPLLEELQDKSSVLLVNDEPLPEDLIFHQFFQTNFKGVLKFRILGNDYDVLVNCPVVEEMTLPGKLIPECTIYAEKLETKFTDESKSKFTWFRSLRSDGPPNSWEKCGEGFFYNVKREDVDHYLKLVCTPKCNEKEGPVSEVVSKTAVENVQNFDEIQKRHAFTKEKPQPGEFRVVSYNILSDIYINTKDGKTVLFVFCEPPYLDINYRKSLLNFELRGYNADIICLQEVDRNFYKSNLLVLFTELGYDCLYHEKEGTREGCSFLYNRKKFNALSVHQYIFSKELLFNPLLDDIKVKIKDNEKLMQRLYSLSTQIQIVVLESLENKEILIVGNTHFYFHPDADHIRLLQGVMSWRILLDTAERVKAQEPHKRVSLILCGDFNSTPECGFHQLLEKGYVESGHVDWKSKEDEAISGVSCEHSTNMKSAYSKTHFTNYTPLFKGCLDYIYFQSDNLELKQTVSIPSEDILSMYSGIPSKFFPSDHVALVADLKFKGVP